MKAKRMNLLMTGIIGSIILLPLGNKAIAQDSAASAAPVVNSPQGGAEKFLLAGEVFTEWQTSKIKGLPTYNSFGANANSPYDDAPLGLMLMPLVKISDRLFLDVQAQVSVNTPAGGGASAALNEAIIYYKVCPAMYLFAGSFQPRCGLYSGILDDFTNRFGTAPVGMAIGFQTQSGIGIQGGIQAGTSKLSYQLYVANGPQLVVDSSGATNGQMSYGNYTDNNLNKSIGGSIGFLPFSSSELEVGVSGQYTPKTGNTGSPFENIDNKVFAAYINYFHVFNPIMIRVLGQYDYTQTKNFNLYTDASESTLLFPSFNNTSTGYYLGATVRASGSESIFLSSLELGGRIGQSALPKDAMWGGNPVSQTTVCLTYWVTWKTPINIAYDMYTQSGSPDVNVFTVRGMWFF